MGADEMGWLIGMTASTAGAEALDCVGGLNWLIGMAGLRVSHNWKNFAESQSYSSYATKWQAAVKMEGAQLVSMAPRGRLIGKHGKGRDCSVETYAPHACCGTNIGP